MKRIYTPLQICFLLILLVACEKFTEPLAFAPEFKLNEASDVSRLSAVISGKITPNGGEIREYGFVYGEYENLANATEVAFEGNPSGEVVTQLYNLDPDTKYYYQLYAGSGVTRVSSEVKSFTTNASDAPKMTKVVELDKNEQSVTVSCQLTDDGGYDVIMMGIAYRRSDSQKYSMTIYDEPTTESFTLTVDGLEAGTSYYVCGFAISRGGIGYGAETSITTEDSEAPVVTTGSIVEYGGSWLIANAQQLSEGFSPVVERGFCYSSTSTMPTLTDGYVTAEGTANELFSAKITGLQGATTYYVRAYARNGTKVGYGKVVEVTTKQLTIPTLAETLADSVTYKSVNVNAVIESEGNGIIQRYGFCYSATESVPTIENSVVVDVEELDEMGNRFGTIINDLNDGTTYYIRAFAINEVGVGYGESISITTIDTYVPVIGELTISDIMVRQVTLSAVISDEGNRELAECGFCWTRDGSEPTLETCVGRQKCTLEGHAFSAVIEGLLSDTKYKVRAYAINEVGVGYGDVDEFRTLIDPVPGEDDNVSPEM